MNTKLKAKLNFKKMGLAFGAVALVATPMLAMVSCGSEKGVVNGTLGLNSQKDKLQLLDLDKVAHFSKATSSIEHKFSQKGVDAVDLIVASMNNEPSWEWHTIGDPITDGVNAIRYVVWKAANAPGSVDIATSAQNATGGQGKPGRQTLLPVEIALRDFINDAQIKTLVNGKVPGNKYNTKAMLDINKWLGAYSDNNNGTINASFAHEFDIPRINNWSPSKSPYGGEEPVSLDDLKKMQPLRMDKDYLAWTEYRTQQIEWRGTFDMHHWDKTNQEMKNASNLALVNRVGIAAPALLQSNPSSGENFVFVYKASPDSPSAATAGSGKFVFNIYEGVLSALSTFYDTDNGGGTDGGFDPSGNDVLSSSANAGHRANLFGPSQGAFGYTITANNTLYGDIPHPYTVQALSGWSIGRTLQKDSNGKYAQTPGGQYIWNSNIDDKTFTQRADELQWLKNGLKLNDEQYKLVVDNLEFQSAAVEDDHGQFISPYYGIAKILLDSIWQPGHVLSSDQVRAFTEAMDKERIATHDFKDLPNRAAFYTDLVNSLNYTGMNFFILQPSWKTRKDFVDADFARMTNYTLSVFPEHGFDYKVNDRAQGLYDVMGGGTAFWSVSKPTNVDNATLQKEFFEYK